MSSVTCGMPIRWASARAPVTACGEQQLRSPSFAASAHSSSVTATTSCPASSASWAATALSTPPLMATSVRPALGSIAAAPARAAAPSARCRASAASSAAWRFDGTRPPSASLSSSGPTRAASRKGAPSTSSTAALAAAMSAPQPLAEKPASTTRSPSTRTASRTRSPQAAPPAAPACGQSWSRPSPRGACRWSWKSAPRYRSPIERSVSENACREKKYGPSLPLPPRELNLAQQVWVSSGMGLNPIPSRTPGSHGVGSNIGTTGAQARAAANASSLDMPASGVG